MKKLLIIVALTLAPSMSLTACGGPDEYALVGTERAAGTDGLLVVEEIEGGNRMLNLTLEHLPPPSRLGQGMTAYIVWLKPANGQPQMASRLAYDEDERTGTATATTPGARFEVLVTAERNANATSPSDVVVARQRVGGGGD
jgi:hypothetical protein